MSASIVKMIKTIFGYEQWAIALRQKDSYKNIEKWKNAKKIKAPKLHFYADPFIIKKNNSTYVFFENYSYFKEKGYISCISIQNGAVSKATNVLEKKYHLSYPYLFEHDKHIYMIPETCVNRTIELYRATQFPDKWKLMKVVMSNIIAVDTTIMFYNNLYWLFTYGKLNQSETAMKLNIFYSDSPLGKWTAHTMNPIGTDIVYSRPAGKIFMQDGKLIRPSQNCNARYGYSTVFNHIEVLTEHMYKETIISILEPQMIDECIATHTYNADEEYEVIDCNFQRFSLLKPIAKITAYVYKSYSKRMH